MRSAAMPLESQVQGSNSARKLHLRPDHQKQNQLRFFRAEGQVKWVCGGMFVQGLLIHIDLCWFVKNTTI